MDAGTHIVLYSIVDNTRLDKKEEKKWTKLTMWWDKVKEKNIIMRYFTYSLLTVPHLFPQTR